MALPAPGSGPLSLSDINVELKKSSTAAISLNDADARSLAGKPSGAISISDFYGKSTVIKYTYIIPKASFGPWNEPYDVIASGSISPTPSGLPNLTKVEMRIEMTDIPCYFTFASAPSPSLEGRTVVLKSQHAGGVVQIVSTSMMSSLYIWIGDSNRALLKSEFARMQYMIVEIYV